MAHLDEFVVRRKLAGIVAKLKPLSEKLLNFKFHATSCLLLFVLRVPSYIASSLVVPLLSFFYFTEE